MSDNTTGRISVRFGSYVKRFVPPHPSVQKFFGWLNHLPLLGPLQWFLLGKTKENTSPDGKKFYESQSTPVQTKDDGMYSRKITNNLSLAFFFVTKGIPLSINSCLSRTTLCMVTKSRGSLFIYLRPCYQATVEIVCWELSPSLRFCCGLAGEFEYLRLSVQQ